MTDHWEFGGIKVGHSQTYGLEGMCGWSFNLTLVMSNVANRGKNFFPVYMHVTSLCEKSEVNICLMGETQLPKAQSLDHEFY